MEKILCFTGHREIPSSEYLVLRDHLSKLLEKKISEGYTCFRAGGAVGFDTLAALTVLLLRKKYPHIRLELILPCPSQTRGWSKNDEMLYRQILSQADSYHYVSEGYYRGVLQVRNRALVEGSHACIAYLRSSHGGGTAYTAALALKKGLEFINLYEEIER